jgi:antitoxin component of MazEF toxin-antitoxin module
MIAARRHSLRMARWKAQKASGTTPFDVLTDLDYRTYVIKRLTRSGNSLALVIDRRLLHELEIDADTDLELSTDGDVLVVTPRRDRKRRRRVADLVSEAHEHYGGVFRRLAE